ncbi:MAG: cofactor-independent phosphoglycerate mutase [Dehalococcoidales bacterium]
MKYIVLIIDGAAGLPLPERGNKTCLELAETPNLDAMAREGMIGLVRTIPDGIEASSANACMSVLGYNPKDYPVGRAAIEAKSMGISINPGEVLFRCNLVTIEDGKMKDYSAGRIRTEEAVQLIEAVNRSLGSDSVRFYPGLNYRHILKIRGREDTLEAECTPPHDISGRPIAGYLPRGPGSDVLVDLMKRSEKVLGEHPVNIARQSRGKVPANMLWLFWGSLKEPDVPVFKTAYGLDAAVTSAVDVILGMAKMMDIDILEIAGVTDGMNNNFSGQVAGALTALEKYDMVIIHVEAPDEAAHGGNIDEKIEAIRIIDSEIVGQLRARPGDDLRVLIMPDHPTPIETRTHSPAPVPFMLWGKGFSSNGRDRYTESQATKTGLLIDPGYNIMDFLVKGK